MSIYYCSTEFTGGEINIPSGGFTPIEFPFTGEKSDAHDMHSRRAPDGTFIGGLASQYIRMPADGIAWITVGLTWKAGAYTWVRDAILVDGLRVETDRRPTTAVDNLITKAVAVKVQAGQTIALTVSHDAATAQKILEARLKVMLYTDLEPPPVKRLRIRKGTDPLAPKPPEGDPFVGSGIAEDPVPPDTDHIPR